jgi:hypothetical protein
VAVPVDRTGTGTASVKAPPVLGVLKPPRRVGKQFWDRLVAAPEKNVSSNETRLVAATSRDLTLMVKEWGPCHKNAVGEVERRDDAAGM